MGRKRRTDLDLPERWKRQHGAIYYLVPPGQEHRWDGKKWFRLGITETEAYRAWADRVELHQNTNTLGQLFDRYLVEHTPTCRPKTQGHQRNAIKHLRLVFGEFLVGEFESAWAFRYYNERKKAGISAANQDLKTLSHVFTKAVEWGVIKNGDHPLRGLRIKQADNVRDRYVEDWELDAFLSVAPRMLQLYVALKLMLGMDKRNMLSLKWSDISDEGISAARMKTKGKQRVYEWIPELQRCIDMIRGLDRPVASVWLFCTRDGQPYRKDNGRTDGFDSIWKRAMGKALAETDLCDRFTEHDLRAKAASDSESIEFAQHLLDHADPKITRKVYRRKKERVTPLAPKRKSGEK